MSNFYIKNKNGEYLPVELNSIMGKDLNKSLVIVKVGSDNYPATPGDLDLTEDSFRQADIINELDISIIITPYQIDVGVITKEEIEDKNIYLQITSGSDISALEEGIRKMYKNMRKKYTTVVMPTPLTVRDYKKVQDVLKRCQIRKERRSRVRG